MNDNEALKLAKNGLQKGYNAIFENHASYLFTLALKITKNTALAEDAVQKTFESAFKNINSFKGNSKLRTWLYSILYRTALKTYYKNNRNTTTEIINDKLYNQNDNNVYETAELAIDINNALNKLNPIYKTALILFYKDDLSINEIAKILETNSNHIKIILYRARKAFKSIWSECNVKGEHSL